MMMMMRVDDIAGSDDHIAGGDNESDGDDDGGVDLVITVNLPPWYLWPCGLDDVDIRGVSVGGPGQGGQRREGGLEQVQHEYDLGQTEEEEEWDDYSKKVKTMHWRTVWRKRPVLG